MEGDEERKQKQRRGTEDAVFYYTPAVCGVGLIFYGLYGIAKELECSMTFE